jgi:hypothetical protein
VSKWGKYKFRSKKTNVGVIPVLTPLSADEIELRALLEKQVGSAFYQAGMALLKLNELRLYRSTHFSFEDFCQDVFSFSRDYAYLKMGAAKIYQNLLDNMPSISRHLLPTRLDDDASLKVWNHAVALAGGKVPTSPIVTEAVRLYLNENNRTDNPFHIGEICRILARGNRHLKNQAGCWCIVSQVHLSSCTVNTWSDELEVAIENLESLLFDERQYQSIEDIGVRMTGLYETGKLDEAALWVLNGLAKLNRPYLTTLEEKLLQLLEREYGIQTPLP